MSVWILVITFYGYREKSATIIDDIANQSECVRVQEIIKQDRTVFSTRCIEVRKLK